MKQMATLLAGLLLAGTAGAGDVYVTKDAKGNLIYTDTPQTIPAEKLSIHSQSGDSAAQGTGQAKPPVQQPASATAPQPQAAQQASQNSADDRAKRCVDARQQYQTLMNSRHLYEEGPNGARTYLTSEQIDQARANAKQVMDQFCADQ